MPFPPDYTERVYAGVLGKIIGVYLGRPFEGWTYDRIMQDLGEIRGYVHEKRGVPLVVTDDDISGTFTFLRALPDHGCSLDLTAEQIGQTWLNYLIERKTILWWGGLGNSTEHTAYLRLKHGIPAPRSGSKEVNGPIVAEQIGAQIFIDGWAMVSPGDPERAASLARRAGSVSHDGEAVYGAQCLAAMEAQAFVEPDINCLLDTGLSVIPRDSTIARLIADLRDWHAADNDWRKTFARIQDRYGYKDYVGGVHMVPNHALIILGLLYGQGDFQESLMVCNTCGWDTDCNSGNLGCLLGIRNGLAGFDGPVDWRGPVADRIYLPTMDGGRCVTDAVSETIRIVNTARRMNGEAPLAPKPVNGRASRFHFEMPGSLQGFRVDRTDPCGGQVELFNTAGHSRLGMRSLGIRYDCDSADAAARVSTATFILPEDLNMPGYTLIASPTLYPGQTLRAGLVASADNAGPVNVRWLLRFYNSSDLPARASGPETRLEPGAAAEITWTLPSDMGSPIFAVGVEIVGPASGTLYLDYLTWDGVANTTFTRPASNLAFPGPSMYRNAWVNAVDQWERWSADSFRVIQNEGRGLITTGEREWQNYRVSAAVRPAMMQAGGLAVRVQGLLRFYALQLTSAGTARLVKVYDGQETVLAEAACPWEMWKLTELGLEARGSTLRAFANGKLLFEFSDPEPDLAEGAVGFVIEEGHMLAQGMKVEPLEG